MALLNINSRNVAAKSNFNASFIMLTAPKFIVTTTNLIALFTLIDPSDQSSKCRHYRPLTA